MYEQKKIIINGKLTEWNYLISRQEEIDKEIEELDHQMLGLRSVNFENTIKSTSVANRDSKLAELITAKEKLEAERKKVFIEYVSKEKELHIDELNDEQIRILKAVLNESSYSKAGKKIGYHRQSIYREMKKIYKILIKHI